MISDRNVSRILLVFLLILGIFFARSQPQEMQQNSTYEINGHTLQKINQSAYLHEKNSSKIIFQNVSIEKITDLFIGNLNHKTDVFAINKVNIDKARLILKKHTDNIEYIAYCPDFDFSKNSCQNWQDSGIEFIQNTTHIIFTIDHFSAYKGETYKKQSTLTTRVSSDINIVTPYQKIKIYANYTGINETISDAKCNITIGSENYAMLENDSLYIFSNSHNTPGIYNYIINCYSQTFKNKTKIISVNISEQPDNDDDTYPEIIDCNDNDPDINPGKEEILYNGIDDDCNPDTLDFILFEISTDKTSLNPGQSLLITVDAANQSDTYLTINSPTDISYVYIFENSSYPLTRIFEYTNMSGEYEIEGTNYYKNYTNNIIETFRVKNNLEITIDAERTEIFKDQKIKFDAEVNGGIPPYSYEWDFDDGYTSNKKNPEHKFIKIKEHKIILKVSDSSSNQVLETQSIEVVPKYELRITIKDNKTKKPISDAEIDFDEIDGTTNKKGKIVFIVTNRTYEILVTAEDYHLYESEFKLNNTHDITIFLEKIQENKPIINLIFPKNNSEIKSSDIKFRFNTSFSKTLNCTIYLTEDNTWWSQEKTFGKITNSNIREYQKLNLSPGEFSWKIECRTKNNSYMSKQNNFMINEKQTVKALSETTEEIPETSSYIQEVYDLLPDLASYSPEQKRVVDLLEIRKILEQSKLELDKANRDLFNLRYKQDVADILEERKKIMDKITNIKNSTPRSVNILKKTEFIKYLDDKDIEVSLEEYIENKDLDFTEKEKKSFIENNLDLQKKLTVETTAYNVEIEYLAGKKTEITLVNKIINYNASSKNSKIIEHIPKQIAQTSDEIRILNKDYQIIKNDPVIEFGLENLHEIKYYFKEKISIDKIPQLKSIIVSENTERSSDDRITGFAIFDKIPKTNNKILVIEVLIIVVLSIIYIGFQFRYSASFSLPKIKKDTPKKDKKSGSFKYETARKSIETAHDLIQKNRLEDAALKYSEISLLYDKISEYQKNKLFPEIDLLAEKIIHHNIKQFINKSYIALAEKDIDNFMSIYSEIKREYKNLSKEQKDEIYPEICRLISIYSLKQDE
ncbi:hypothetical protein GF327_06560 [Candidatus Woesearchaeota archaeon]|nr:hypothetical protein [Candidatus Woesearchaeota archaeon]